MNVKKGDIIEVININNYERNHTNIRVGNRYIADSNPREGMVIIKNDRGANVLRADTYILWKKSEDIGKILAES